MEGLIPMVYRSIKRSRTRRRYRCLSSSSGGTAARTSFEIADFYPAPNHLSHYNNDRRHQAVPPITGSREESYPGHRQIKSSFAGGEKFYAGLDEVAYYSVKPKQLVRFTSHKMFSFCLTGGGVASTRP